jgi:hypothetical protein
MRERIIAWTVLCILALCALNSCAKPKYIIPGLTLPPGATVIKSNDSLIKGNTIRHVYIWFNCPGGWDVVTQHVDKCMRRAGYRDITADILQAGRNARSGNEEGFEELNPVLSEPDSPDQATEDGIIAKYFRYYGKQGGECKVMLWDYAGWSATPSAKDVGKYIPIHKTSDYIINVQE